jgi:hypothetical protein
VSEPWFVQVLDNGVEVARVELDDPGGINRTYANVPVVGDDERLEIQLIEVATAQLRRKVGTRVVHDLMERHSGPAVRLQRGGGRVLGVSRVAALRSPLGSAVAPAVVHPVSPVNSSPNEEIDRPIDFSYVK